MALLIGMGQSYDEVDLPIPSEYTNCSTALYLHELVISTRVPLLLW